MHQRDALYQRRKRQGGTIWAPTVSERDRYHDASIVLNLTGWDRSHIHLQQDEYFKVEQGLLGLIKDGVEYTLTKDNGVFFIPSSSRHVLT